MSVVVGVVVCMVVLVPSSLAWTTPAAAATTSSTTTTSSSSLTQLHMVIKAIRPELDLLDLSGGRPGAILESEAELERKAEMFLEIERDRSLYPEWMSDYGELLSDVEAVFDSEEGEDSSKLGEWDISYLKSKFDYELDPAKGDDDPNALLPNKRYLKQIPQDDDGVDIGYNPILGPSYPMDERTIVGTVDSYMVDEESRDERMLTPLFPPDDMEIQQNEDIRAFRKSLDIIEKYTDPFFPEYEVPRHMQPWYGYPERLAYPEQNYTNNRFTKEEEISPFDEYHPHKARKLAVQYARAKNAEWLRPEISLAYHAKERAPYDRYGTLVGTTQPGECHPAQVAAIGPALKILGSIADLLSIDGNIYRFHYHGLIKNKFGMSCWVQTLLEDCGVTVDSVIFETGFRKRDPWYDGGSHWYGPY